MPEARIEIDLLNAQGEVEDLVVLHRSGDLPFTISPEEHGAAAGQQVRVRPMRIGIGLETGFIGVPVASVTPESPVTEPPATEPPATEPPATEPPATPAAPVDTLEQAAAAVIAGHDQSALYSIQDLSSLYTSEDGLTPAQAGDPVGLILDKKAMGGMSAANYMAANGYTPATVPGAHRRQPNPQLRPILRFDADTERYYLDYLPEHFTLVGPLALPMNACSVTAALKSAASGSQVFMGATGGSGLRQHFGPAYLRIGGQSGASTTKSTESATYFARFSGQAAVLRRDRTEILTQAWTGNTTTVQQNFLGGGTWSDRLNQPNSATYAGWEFGCAVCADPLTDTERDVMEAWADHLRNAA